ncbi:D-Ala-D-Ala carboxypeptidase family metallohydrolase [Vibrio cholerae]|uniref:D-Ala-D-Ala carboxypeptidase family metallohydrolase n=1 Tax=Vibrio cholerae TaxID=666 RepID=UPI0038371160
MELSRWANFSDNELRCKCGCNQSNPNIEFVQLMDKVQLIRQIIGVPLPVSSAYRCVNHPEERKKAKAGWHNKAAIDLAVSRDVAYKVLELAFIIGIKGIGINQKGEERFIHLDMRPELAIWSY